MRGRLRRAGSAVLARGADARARDSAGQTAADRARRRGHVALGEVPDAAARRQDDRTLQPGAAPEACMSAHRTDQPPGLFPGSIDPGHLHVPRSGDHPSVEELSL